MKHRITALVALAFLAACGQTPTQPTPLMPAQPSFSHSHVNVTPSAPTIVNGSFENGLTGWTYPDPSQPGEYVDVGAFWQAADGINSVDLNGVYAGYVSQDITTTPGITYTVLFDLAGNPGYPQNVKQLEVSAAGASADYYFDTTGKSNTNMGWTEESFTFTATSATTTLTFTSLHTGDGYPDRAQGPALDNVRISIASPTTKAECKKGGWASYGFRNQGQCVRYIETGKDSR